MAHVAVQSDVPVSPGAAEEFAACLTGWLHDVDATPVCISGLPGEKDGVPSLYGVGHGDARSLLDEHDIGPPCQDGVCPVAGVTVDTDTLVEQAEEISTAREELAERMQDAGQESSSAQPIGMYQ